MLITGALVTLAGIFRNGQAHRSDVERSGSDGERAAPPAIRTDRPERREQAVVQPPEAWRIARDALRPGDPESGTLEELGGRLVYVLVFTTGDGRIDEVILDAASGRVISVRRTPPSDAGTR